MPCFRRDAAAQSKRKRLRVEALESRLVLTADYSVQAVLFVPEGSRDDRADEVLSGLQAIQEQWESWGWTFRASDEVPVVYSDRPASAFQSNGVFNLIRDEVIAELTTRGEFNPTVKYAIFGEDTSQPGAAAQANTPGNISIYYDGAVEEVANADYGVIGHEVGHNFGLLHENCQGLEPSNSDIPSVGPMCNGSSHRSFDQFPAEYQFSVVEQNGPAWLAEFSGGYAWEVTYASDLDAAVTTGQIAYDTNVSGGRLKLDANPWGAGYDKGIGAGSGSSLTYDIGGAGYERFQTNIGIDDSVGRRGSVVFVIRGDGEVLFESGVVTSRTPREYVDVRVAGVETLQIIVQDADGSAVGDLANWANARFVSGLSLTGDFNGDGGVDQADLTVWRESYGRTYDPTQRGGADANQDGVVNAADYSLWRDHFGDEEVFPLSANDNAYTRLSTEPGGSFEGNLLTNDVGAGLRVVALDGLSSAVSTFYNLPSGGAVFVSSRGQIDIIADGRFPGLAPGESTDTSFTYTVRDTHGDEATGTVVLTIVGAAAPAQSAAHAVAAAEASEPSPSRRQRGSTDRAADNAARDEALRRLLLDPAGADAAPPQTATLRSESIRDASIENQEAAPPVGFQRVRTAAFRAPVRGGLDRFAL